MAARAQDNWSQEAESEECRCSALFVFTVQGRPAQMMVPPTFTMGLPTSINAL